MVLALAVLTIASVAALIALNVRYQRRLREMSQAERDSERTELSFW
jgi:hypothetical protein